MTKNRTLLAAAFVVLAFGAAPTFAAEGGDPFASGPGGSVTAVQLRSVAADVGSEQEYDLAGRPGTGLALSAELLPVNGSEGIVQTANSVPPKFEDGTVQFAHARDAQATRAAQLNRATPATDRHYGIGPQG